MKKNYLYIIVISLIPFFSFSIQKEHEVKRKEIDSLLAIAKKEVYNNRKVALNAIEKAEAIVNTIDNNDAKADVLLRKAVTNYISSDYDKALELYLKALVLFKKTNNQEGIAKCYTGQGIILLGVNQFSEALFFFNKVNKINHKIKSDYGICSNYLNIGIALMEQKKLQPALKYLNKSFEIAEKSNSVSIEHMALVRLGEIHLHLKNYDKAVHYLSSVINHKVMPNQWEKSFSYYLLSKYHLEKNQIDKAEEFAVMAYHIANELKANWDLEKITKLMHQIYYSKGILKKAYTFSLLHSKYRDSVLNETNLRIVNLNQLKQLKAENDKIVAEKLVAKNDLKNTLLITTILMIIVAYFINYLRLKNKLKSIALKNATNEKNLLDEKLKNEVNLRLLNEHIVEKQKSEQLAKTLENVKLSEQLQQIKKNLESNSNIHLKKELDKIKVNDKIWNPVIHKFNTLHPNFEKNLSLKFPGLTKKDIEFCSFIKMNLSYKEISNTLQISHDSVFSKKYRIVKKMKIDPETDFYQLIQSIE